ncbi:hypothetical protein NXC24_PC00043 (plasmid) [Rhizobium sp. NXC24]|nr:hypothetical protein NXC24_PC00043 [Rhizobium sp. NXC24]
MLHDLLPLRATRERPQGRLARRSLSVRSRVRTEQVRSWASANHSSGSVASSQRAPDMPRSGPVALPANGRHTDSRMTL